jgi:hypothetical protein
VTGLALCGAVEQLGSDVHERLRVALCVIGEGRDQLGRHQLGGAGLLQGVHEKLGKLIGRCPFGLVGDEHRARQGGIDVRLLAVTQDLGAGPSGYGEKARRRIDRPSRDIIPSPRLFRVLLGTS